MVDSIRPEDLSNPSKLSEAYDRVLKQLKERSAAFKREFKETLKEFAGEGKTALEQMMDVVGSGGKLKERKNALERFLFGENTEQMYQKQLIAYQNYLEIVKKTKARYADNEDKQKAALFLLNQNKEQIMGISSTAKNEDSGGFVGDMVNGMSDELSEGLSKMLTDFENFEVNFQNLGKNLANKMIKISSDALMKLIFNEQNAANAIMAIRATYGAVKGIASGFKGLLGFGISGLRGNFDMGGMAICHSGGIIPEGANVNLPGTDEQLALLKGGERILSPGENVEYERNSGGSNVVFNNFNVKAWDSKDVQKYLLENKQLLNAITYEGIKDNNQRLRQIVRNA